MLHLSKSLSNNSAQKLLTIISTEYNFPNKFIGGDYLQGAFKVANLQSKISTTISIKNRTNKNMAQIRPKCQKDKTSYNFSELLKKQLIDQDSKDKQQKAMCVQAKAQSMLFFNQTNLSSLIRLKQMRSVVSEQWREEKYVSKQVSGGSGITGQNQNKINSLRQLLKKTVQICRQNEQLSKGNYEEYKQYAVAKLVQIGLKFIQRHESSDHQQLYKKIPARQHWSSLQHHLKKRMHNCSLRDYLKILYIALQSYTSIYKFQNKFVQSLISGVRRQVPLMEQMEVMKLFLVLSHGARHKRTEWQLNYKFTQQNQFTLKQSKRRSPYFEHEFLTTIQEDILEKIVKKYQKKYMNTELNFKQDDLLKICFWLRLTIAFKNTPFSRLIQDEDNSRNKYVVGLVNVLISRYHPMNDKMKKSSSAYNTNQKLIQNKSLQFNSTSQMIQFFQILSISRDYLNQQSQIGLKQQGIDQKSKLLIQKSKIWLQKSIQLNQVMMVLIKHANLQTYIHKNHQDKLDDAELTQGKANFEQVLQERQCRSKMNIQQAKQMWKLINLIHQCYNFRQVDPEIAYDWYSRLINQHKIFNRIVQTTQFINGNQHSYQQVTRTKIQMGQLQFNILYDLFNRSNSINDKDKLRSEQVPNGEQNKHGYSNKNISLQTTDWIYVQKSVLYGCFYNTLGQIRNRYYQKYPAKRYSQEQLAELNDCKQQTNAINSNNRINKLVPSIYLPHILHPSTILKLIKYQLSLYSTKFAFLNVQIEQMIHQFPAIELVVKYTQQMLRLGDEDSQTFKQYYLRQLEFVLSGYLKLVAKLMQDLSKKDLSNQTQKSNQNNPLISRIQTLLQIIQARNQSVKYYLEQNNFNFQNLINNDKINTFTTHVKYLSLNSAHRTIRNNQIIKQQQYFLIQAQKSYSKQTILMGQFIMKCIQNQRKKYLMHEDIVKLTKFFTQIKAFKQIKFCHPLTDYLVCPQFVFIPPSQKLQTQILAPLVIIFLKSEQIQQPSTLALSLAYSVHQMKLFPINVRQFLNMHINQRIQTLNMIIFQYLNTIKNQGKYQPNKGISRDNGSKNKIQYVC